MWLKSAQLSHAGVNGRFDFFDLIDFAAENTNKYKHVLSTKLT